MANGKIRLLLPAVIFTLYVAFQAYMYHFRLSVVPDEFDVYWMSYWKEDGIGFGPGACESGVRVFGLSEDIVEKVERGDIAYLNSLRSQNEGGFGDWQETPILVTRYWTDYMGLKNDADYSKHKPSVFNYMDPYGCSPDIAHDIRDLVDNAIASKGNYYSQSASAVMIIIPREKKLIYIYH